MYCYIQNYIMNKSVINELLYNKLYYYIMNNSLINK